jgi:hypothetical protein
MHHNKFLYNKPTRCTNFWNLFWKGNLHVSDSSSFQHQKFFTVHTAMVCHTGLVTACKQDQDDPARKLSFDVRMTMHRDKFLYNKPTRCTNFSNLFWKENLHVSDSSSVYHQEFFTVHTAMVYVIQVCWQLASGIRKILLASCQQSCMAYIIAVCSVKNSWWLTEELSETCRFLFQE